MRTNSRAETAQPLGAYDFLPMPFEVGRLIELVERGPALFERDQRLRDHSAEVLQQLRQLREKNPLGVPAVAGQTCAAPACRSPAAVVITVLPVCRFHASRLQRAVGSGQLALLSLTPATVFEVLASEER